MAARPRRGSGATRRPPGVAPTARHRRATAARRCGRRPVRRWSRRPPTPTEVTGPAVRPRAREPDGSTTSPASTTGEPSGSASSCTGRVLDGDGRPVPDTLIEVWQANASGRYRHASDQWPGPLDPNFTGARPAPRPTTTAATASSRSGPAPTRGRTTTTPGAPRTSTSRCSAGRSPSVSSPRCTSRTTRCSSRTRSSARSPRGGAPTAGLALRPRRHRARVGARLRFDIVLRGRDATPFEDPAVAEQLGSRRRRRSGRSCTSSWSGPTALTPSPRGRLVRLWVSGALLDGAGATRVGWADRDLAGRS